jgi:hypothetical protein
MRYRTTLLFAAFDGETSSLAGSSADLPVPSMKKNQALFSRPKSITLTGSNLNVADTGNNTIRKS